MRKIFTSKNLKEFSVTSDIEKIIERVEDLETLFGENTIREFMANIQNVKGLNDIFLGTINLINLMINFSRTIICLLTC